MDNSTMQLIAEARELCAKATSGEWKWNGDILITTESTFLVMKPYYDDNTDVVSTVIFDGDKDFIARSRTIIPELCDSLEKTEAKFAALKDEKLVIKIRTDEDILTLDEAIKTINRFRKAYRETKQNLREAQTEIERLNRIVRAYADVGERGLTEKDAEIERLKSLVGCGCDL